MHSKLQSAIQKKETVMPFWIIVLILNLEMRKPCWCSWPNCCFLTLQSVLQLFRAKLFSFWIDFSRDFNQKLLLNNFLITSTSETSHGPWKIRDIFLMPTVERSLMVSKTVVKVSDWEPEDCNNLTHVIYFLIIFEMVCTTWLFLEAIA